MSINEIEKLQAQVDELSGDIKMIAERQNSQYTDIMLQLKELKDEMRTNGIAPVDNRTVDELYEMARNAVVLTGKASTSYIQRKLGVGYSRAASLMDMLEAKGVIGKANGSKPREIINN